MENSSRNSKQQILCYILRLTPLYPPRLPSLIKESPLCSTEPMKSQQCELSCQQDKIQDLNLQPTDPLLQDTPVSDITETVPTENPFETFVPKARRDFDLPVFENGDKEDFIFEVDNVEEVTDEDFIPEIKTELKEEKESHEIEGAMEDIDPTGIEEVIPDIFRDNGEEKGETNVLKVNKESLSMDTTGCIKITPDVFTASIIKYLVRIDKQEFAFADDEKTALAIINSLANAEVKKLANPGVKVFRRDLNDGKEVQICTQSLGVLMNGRVSRNTVIDLIPVPKVFIILPEPVGVSLQK
jgi:hypothetical protein